MKRARAMGSVLLALAITGAVLRMVAIVEAWYATLWVVLSHLALAAVLVVLIGPFLWSHVRRIRSARSSERIGWYLLICLTGITASGVALLVIGQRGRLALLHIAFAFGLVLLLAWHARFSSLRRMLRSRICIGSGVVVVALTFGAALASTPGRASKQPTLISFARAQMQVVDSVPPYDQRTMAPERCALCHADIVSQWQQSIHAVADTELVYARVVGDFRQRYGFTASNWCAGCHSPLRLARNQLSDKVADVPQPNVNCIGCHSIQEIHQPVGNNGFDMAIRTAIGYEAAEPLGLADRLLLVQPSAHLARWNSALVRNPAFCGSCHRQVLPSELANGQGGVVLQDTYGEWQRSRYNSADPLVRRTCQNCHMPSASGIAGDLGNKPPSHLFAGGSRDVAKINGARTLYAEQERLLQGAATISIAGTACTSRGAELLVHIANTGAGHNLPTGVTDLRQVWLDVRVSDNHGRPIYRSGAINDQGFLDSNAVRFGVVLGDDSGQPVAFHDIARARRILSDTTLPAGATRIIHYSLPALVSSTLRVEAYLNYQSVPQNLINHYITTDVRFEQVTMASAARTITLPSPCHP